VGPGATQIGQKTHPDHGIFGSCGAGPWTQGSGDERLGGACKNAQRQVAMVLVGMVIQGECLLPMRGIIGMVHIEDNRWGRLGITRHKVVDQGAREAIEVLAVSLLVQTGHSGRAGSVRLGVQGRPLETECDEGIPAEAMGIVSVRIPRRDLRDAVGQQVVQWMIYVGLVTLIMDRRREACSQPKLAVAAS
jgi:hypothetical protein